MTDRAPPFSLRMYARLSSLLAPLAPLLLRLRLGRGKEKAERLGERSGTASLPRPDGRLIWVHGASVGETLSVLPLIDTLAAEIPDISILLTCTTVTAAEIAEQRLPARTRHQFVPLDLPPFVERFLDHWRPDAALFVESEIWPNTLLAARARRIPCALVNARLSLRSARRWALAPAAIGWLLGGYDRLLAQSQADADRLAALGAGNVAVTGNLKLDAPAPPVDEAELAALRQACGDRPLFLAASTHPGEEALVADAHMAIARSTPQLLTIVAPRHPERGPAIAQDLVQRGLAFVRRSTGALPDAGTQIYLADTLGEMGLFYRLAGLAFMGGSLVPRGGQNPIEPAKLATAILHGPHIFNFADIYALIDEAGGGRRVTTAGELAQAVVRLLADDRLRKRMAKAAADAVEAGGGALERTVQALRPIVANMEP